MSNEHADRLSPPTTWPATTWLSVASLSLGTYALASSEVLPMGLLTALAEHFAVTPGVTGQTVAATALFAGLSAPTIALLIGRLDRRHAMLSFMVIVVASNLLSIVAPNFWCFALARALLGVAIGGFFALAGASVVKVAGLASMGKAMAVVFLGMTLANISAPPVATMIEAHMGWRAAFGLAAGFGAMALLLQIILLPRIPATGAVRLSTFLELAFRPKVRLGLVAIFLVFGGNVAGFAFVRPYLEAQDFASTSIALALLIYGLGGVVGNSLGGMMADKRPEAGFAAVGSTILLTTCALALLQLTEWPVLLLLAVWGVGTGAAPVLIQTWMSRAATDQLEAVGGLFLSVLQFSLALGAVIGGLAFDLVGSAASFLTAAAGGGAAALVILLGARR